MQGKPVCLRASADTGLKEFTVQVTILLSVEARLCPSLRCEPRVLRAVST